MRYANVFTLLFILIFSGCGGGKAPVTTPTPPAVQIPSGNNWEFVFSNASSISGNPSQSDTYSWGAQLYELSPPTITTNTVNGFYGSVGYGYAELMGLTGTISGGGVNLTTSTSTYSEWKGVMLTGTMAGSQEQMNGTWEIPGSLASGTWTAQLLTPVTGTYLGTLTTDSSPASSITVTLELVENTSQSSQLGLVTGTITVHGAACDGSFNVTNSNANNSHQGESLWLKSDPDANGVTAGLASVLNAVSPDGTTIDVAEQGAFGVSGGPCAGYYVGTLSRQ